MASKRSSSKGTSEPARKDDLKLINGIGPIVEKRLLDDGIYTFAHLAAFLPGDLAAKLTGLPGMSAKRIIREDWIGQARKLDAKSTLSEAHKDFEATAVPSAPSEHLQATTNWEEPHNTTTEPESNEVQGEFEAPADSALVDKLQARVKQTPPIELTHAAPLLEEPQKDTETMESKEKFHPATFTVELLLDENNYVHNARVIHVEGQHERSWTGWPNTNLIDFLSESVELNIPSDESAFANAEEQDHEPPAVAESKPLTPPAAELRLTGQIHLREMEIMGGASSSHRKTLARNKPFDVRLTLDLTEIAVPDNTLLNYKASIFVKSRGSSSDHSVAEAVGTIESADKVTINVAGPPLVEGTYRMAATVMVALPGTKLTVKPGTTAVIGDMLEVY